MDSVSSYGSSASSEYAKRLQEMFNNIDTDGDGQFSLEEFTAAKPANAPSDGPDSSEIFAEIDSDGDGFITEEEFAAAPPPPPPPLGSGGGQGGFLDEETLSTLLSALEEYSTSSTEEEVDETSSEQDDETDTTEVSEEDIRELLQDALEYRNAAFTQASSAYANTNELTSIVAQQQTLFTL